MINSIVAPLVTNVTLYPNPTNAATNYRNQSTAQFEVLRASVNTELQKLNSVTDGSSGADQIGMTPIAVTGTANTVQSVTEALAVGYVPFAVGSVDLAGNSITATITGIDTLVNGMAVAIEITETAYSVTDTAITLNINSLGAFEICYIGNLVDATTLSKAKRIAATSIFTVRYNAAQSIWIVQ
jgi:hypothetical protein